MFYNWHFQIHLDMKSSIRHHSTESAAAEVTETVSIKEEMLVEPWRCIDTEGGILKNADVSNIYRRHGISDAVVVSRHNMPWYPFESFGPRNVAFGVKPEIAENQLQPTVDTRQQRPETVDRQMNFETGDSGGRWQLEQLISTAAESDETDVRPLRAVASVVATPLMSSATELPLDCRSLCSDSTHPASHFLPPPLISVPSSPSTSGHVQPPGMPFSGRVLNTGMLAGHSVPRASLREESQSPAACGETMSELEPETDDGRCSAPAERTNHEAHRSKNAMYVAHAHILSVVHCNGMTR